ncbi:MAG: hypothetical protein HRU19_24265 [Pseudobacteriovorax sp.]|nr:hypothetical protein [Pseudobacteriovorax sp.]
MGNLHHISHVFRLLMGIVVVTAIISETNTVALSVGILSLTIGALLFRWQLTAIGDFSRRIQSDSMSGRNAGIFLLILISAFVIQVIAFSGITILLAESFSLYEAALHGFVINLACHTVVRYGCYPLFEKIPKILPLNND